MFVEVEGGGRGDCVDEDGVGGHFGFVFVVEEKGLRSEEQRGFGARV